MMHIESDVCKEQEKGEQCNVSNLLALVAASGPRAARPRLVAAGDCWWRTTSGSGHPAATQPPAGAEYDSWFESLAQFATLALEKSVRKTWAQIFFLLNNIHKYLVKSQSYTIGPAPAALQTQKRGIFENLPRNVNADLCWLIKMKMCGLGLIIKLNARVAGPLCGAARWCAVWARPL